MQPDGNFAVERDGAAEITDLAGCVFAQVLELFDEGGWFQSVRFSGNQGACGLFLSGKLGCSGSLLKAVNTIRIFRKEPQSVHFRLVDRKL